MSLPLALRGPSRFQSVILLSALILTTHFSFSQSDQSGVHISNFGKINANYYRGGQPTVLEFLALQKLGVKTVIDLQKDGMFQEPSWVQNAGMRYFRIPLSSSHPATPEQTDYFLKLVNDPANWPVYVHCAGGRHRTGEMTAIYRINQDSWTADRAYNEMKQYGYYSFPNHGSLRNYVFRYFRDFQGRAKKENQTSVSNPTRNPTPVIGAN